MTALLPQYSLRWCKACGKSFGTCYPLAMQCPYCAVALPDVSRNWPHVCASGHGAQAAGECGRCGERAVSNGVPG